MQSSRSRCLQLGGPGAPIAAALAAPEQLARQELTDLADHRGAVGIVGPLDRRAPAGEVRIFDDQVVGRPDGWRWWYAVGGDRWWYAVGGDQWWVGGGWWVVVVAVAVVVGGGGGGGEVVVLVAAVVVGGGAVAVAVAVVVV